MLYEIRTYDLKRGTLAEFERRFAEKLPGRVEYSPLGGLWHTEIGRLNQVVHIWPYEDLNQRADVRARVAADGRWPPQTADLIANMQSEVFHPAPFMTPLGQRSIGPVYEMRTYTYPPGAIPKVIEAWAKKIEARERLSPLAGCWYSEFGALNRWVHLWAYRSLDERARVRAEAQQKGVWPPDAGVYPLVMENRILLPASCSPMQ